MKEGLRTEYSTELNCLSKFTPSPPKRTDYNGGLESPESIAVFGLGFMRNADPSPEQQSAGEAGFSPDSGRGGDGDIPMPPGTRTLDS